VYSAHEKEIRAAAQTLAALYRDVAFPAMKVFPGLHKELLGHEGACFRCHGTLTADRGPKKGTQLQTADDCSFCHKEPETVSGAPPPRR
jgi:hypothetical protein